MSDLRPKYVPILKSKQGEFAALREMAPGVRASVTPLIDVIRVPLDKRARPLEEHLDKIAKKIHQSWGCDSPTFFDVTDLPLDSRTSGGEHPVRYLGLKLFSMQVTAIPAVGLERDDEYMVAAKAVVDRAESVLIRLLPEDMDFPDELPSQLDALMDTLELGSQQAHVLLDLGSIVDTDAAAGAGIIVRTLRALPEVSAYASVVVAASSVPQSLSQVIKADSIGRLRRNELDLWRLLQTMPGVPRRPSFGDYGVVHPDSLDLDPKKLTLGAAIRYTCGDEVLVLRGRAFKRHPDGYGQFHSLSELLVGMPDYKGATFSWGDRRITDCAQRRCTSGNLTTWVQVGTSHHLALVADQLGLT